MIQRPCFAPRLSTSWRISF